MMRKIEFTILGSPASKKNSQQIVYPKGRKPIIVQSKTYKDYEKACKQFMPKMDKPIDYPVNIEAVFYRKDRRRVDLTNLLAALSDILVKYGVLADDNRNIVYSVNNSKVLYDKNAPRTEIRITEVPEGEFESWEGVVERKRVKLLVEERPVCGRLIDYRGGLNYCPSCGANITEVLPFGMEEEELEE